MKRRYRIRLDTLNDIQNFIAAAAKVNGDVTLSNDSGYNVSAKSLLGAIYTMEWDRIFCYADCDIYELIKEWVIDD